ncbi:MAG: hypothetical protein E5Y88_22305 [Mesorhizobium sp.]|uniref:hypothetical protein n=1 Tax=Mesorhizobium sp. TaxID=1871066 RepID=UPI0012232D99|nr:hypothetical protein [Mesorhizobium sp.]TIL23662.1 MAG: hypothetical protein E5Y88_22305 [Mesorhizobium sp.]
MGKIPTEAANEADELAAEEAARAAARALAIEINRFRAATWDRASTSFLAGGFVGPVISFMVAAKPWSLQDGLYMVLVTGICLIVALFLHHNGREMLTEAFK